MMLKNKIFLVCIFVNLLFLNLRGQEIDNKLDSIIRSTLRENMKLPNYHPYNDIEIIKRIRNDYKRQNDSTFISLLNQKIHTAPKKEVIGMVTNWLDVFNKPNSRDLDSTWHQIMRTYYCYDRESCKNYCGQHQIVYRIYAEDRYKGGSIFEPYPIKNQPYMVFLYKNYRLTEVLPIILADNDLDEEKTMRMAKNLYQDFSRNQCKSDTTCIKEANEFIKYYFKLNQDLKPKEYYLKAFDGGEPFISKMSRISREKKDQKSLNYKKN